MSAGATVLGTYTYNAQGQRTRKVSAAGTTLYHYDRTGNLLLETNAQGLPLRAYAWAEGAPVAQVDIAAGTETVTYLHTDHLGTPRLATNATGIAVWRWEGEAFGATPPNEDPDQDQILTTVNLRFPGQYYDAETGLYYNWNRYYDPKIGRYLTSDPLSIIRHVQEWAASFGLPDQPAIQLNPYVYVNGNPLTWFDTEGLKAEVPWPETPKWPKCGKILTKKDFPPCASPVCAWQCEQKEIDACKGCGISMGICRTILQGLWTTRCKAYCATCDQDACLRPGPAG